MTRQDNRSQDITRQRQDKTRHVHDQGPNEKQDPDKTRQDQDQNQDKNQDQDKNQAKTRHCKSTQNKTIQYTYTYKTRQDTLI